MSSSRVLVHYPRSDAKVEALRQNGWTKHYFVKGTKLCVDQVLQDHLDNWRKDKVCIEKYLTACGYNKQCIKIVSLSLKAKGIIVKDWEGVILGDTYVRADSISEIKSELKKTNMTRTTGVLISKAKVARLLGISDKAVKDRIDCGLISCVGGKVEEEALRGRMLKEADQEDFAEFRERLETVQKCKIKFNGRERLLELLKDEGLVVDADSRLGRSIDGHWYVTDGDAAEILARQWIRNNGKYLVRKKSKAYWLANVDQDFLTTIKQLWQLNSETYDERLDGKLMPILFGTLKVSKTVQNFDNGDIQNIMEELPEVSKNAFLAALIKHAQRKQGRVAYCKQNIQLHDEILEQRKRDRSAYDYTAYVAMGVALYTKFAITYGILDRALEDSECAQALLYMALHVACAWHAEDMQLIHFGLKTRKIVQDCMEYVWRGDFENKKFDELWRAFEIYVFTNKALKQKGQLVEACPTDFRKRLAVILAIAEWHRDEECRELLIENSVIGNVKAYKRLLSPEIYNAIFQGKRFRNSKIVKTLLKRHAELTARKYDDIGLKNMPYRVASYLRGHKQEIYKSPKTIFYYVDNCTDGYTSDEVLWEMKWDGFVGVYASVLIEALLRNDIKVVGDDGELLKKLDIHQQSVLMSKFEIADPLEIEQKMETLERFLANESRVMRDMPVNMAQMRKVALEFTYDEDDENAKEEHVRCVYAKLTGMQCKNNDGCPYCSNETEGHFWCDLALYSRLYVINLETRRQNNVIKMEAYQRALETRDDISANEEAAMRNMVKRYHCSAAYLSELIKDFVVSCEEPEFVDDLIQVLEEEVYENVFSKAS